MNKNRVFAGLFLTVLAISGILLFIRFGHVFSRLLSILLLEVSWRAMVIEDYLFLASRFGGAEHFLLFLSLILVPLVIYFLLEIAARRGIIYLWIVTGILTLAVVIVGSEVRSIPILNIYCGPLCGDYISLRPFTLAIIAMISAIIQSIPQLQARRWLRVAIALIPIELALFFGLNYAIS